MRSPARHLDRDLPWHTRDVLLGRASYSGLTRRQRRLVRGMREAGVSWAAQPLLWTVFEAPGRAVSATDELLVAVLATHCAAQAVPARLPPAGPRLYRGGHLLAEHGVDWAAAALSGPREAAPGPAVALRPPGPWADDEAAAVRSASLELSAVVRWAEHVFAGGRPAKPPGIADTGDLVAGLLCGDTRAAHLLRLLGVAPDLMRLELLAG